MLFNKQGQEVFLPKNATEQQLAGVDEKHINHMFNHTDRQKAGEMFQIEERARLKQ